jgi:O-antigen/teichoic acid export membrane protein
MIPSLLLYSTSNASLMIGVAAQLISIVILARYLGSEQFGQLMVITAATTLGAQLCGLGAGEAMVRRLVRDPSLYRTLLGHNLILIFASGTILSLITIGGMWFFARNMTDTVGYLNILLIMIPSNLFLFRLVSLTEQIFIARHEFWRANVVNVSFQLARALMAFLACIVFGVGSLQGWAVWHGVTYVCVSLACAIVLWPRGAPHWHVLRDELWRGINLSVSSFFLSLRQNIDLLALSAVVTPGIVGTYSVARRIVSTALITGSSFERLIYPRLARAGERGPSATLHLALKYLAYSIAIASATSLGLFIVAPVLPYLFGRDFGDAIPDLKILCWILIFAATQNIAFDALNAADRHGIQALVYNTASIASAAIIILFTYRHGLSGTFFALYLSEGSIAAALWMTLTLLSRYNRGSATTRPTE